MAMTGVLDRREGPDGWGALSEAQQPHEARYRNDPAGTHLDQVPVRRVLSTFDDGNPAAI